ncbi:MAG: DUF2235 domain-containing protein [Pseudomonadota bacterium]
MTKIVVFCDGTWNDPKIDEPTSIVDLHKVCINDPTRHQITEYIPGVGTKTDQDATNQFDTKFQGTLKKYGGGAFGWGLDGKVKLAYQFICQNYKKGDQIYLFGFSRGAFTARSVAGMIRKCGLSKDVSVDGINKAYKLYQKRWARNRPDEEHIMAARKDMSPKFSTSERDQNWRGDDGSEVVNLAYLGVLDTVGALGIPPLLFGGLGPVAMLWNRKYRFHDTELSSLVRSARHAIAVDERRIVYQPSRWRNLRKLNGDQTGSLRPYQQTWFIGTHGILGGSFKDGHPLSVIPFAWVVRGADSVAFENGSGVDDSIADPLFDHSELKEKGEFYKRWRSIPKDKDDIHKTVIERMEAIEKYRPKTLAERLKSFFGG